MAKLSILKASTDVTVYVFIQDSSVTTGAGKTGLAYNTASLVCYYVRPLASAAALTLATQTVTGAHSDGGFVEVDSTNMPGLYRLDLSDAICATGVNSVVVMLKGAANMAPVTLEIQLTSYNPNDAVRLGLTSLPNAAADAAGGLIISDAGGLDADAQLVTKINDILTDTGTTLDDLIDDLESRIGVPSNLGGGATIAANLADIEGQTDDIGVAGAGLTALATQTSVNTIDDLLDTEIPALTAALNGLVLVSGTIGATGNDTTHLHLSGLAYANDGINSMLLTIKDVSTGLYYSRWIEDFVDASDLATVATLPFTPEASVDLYWLTPVRADVTGGSGLDAAGVRAAIGLASANLDTQLDALPTNAELTTALGTADDATLAAIAALNNISTAQVNAEVDAALADINLDHLVKIAVDTNFATTVHADSVVGQMADNGAGFDRTTDSLEALRDRGDAAWITATGFSTHSAADVWAAATRTLTAQSDSAGVTTLLTRITAALEVYTAAHVRSAVGLASANIDTQLGDLPTNSELTTALAGADDAVLAAIAALNNLSAAQVNAEVVDALITDVIADSVATDGSRPTIAQALLLMYRFLLERSVSGTTLTVRKEDGATASATFTLNDASSPTSITRAS